LGIEGAPALVRFPYIQNAGGDHASILWATSDPADAFVDFSADGLNFTTVPAVSRSFARAETGLLPPFTQYRSDLTGLTPKTMYVYRVNTGGQYLAQGRFRTAGSGPFRFVAIGDSGQGSEPQRAIAARIASEDPAFMLHAGDIAYMHGRHLDFQLNHFNVYSSVLSVTPFFPVPGNHEYETLQAQPFLLTHAVPIDNVPEEGRGRYYSFDWGNAHFVCLDSNTSLQRASAGDGEMLRWLERDLRATRQFWRVAVIHHTPYGAGPNQQEIAPFLVRSAVVPILEAYGVQLVLSGHEHSYQRSHHLRDGSVVPANTGTVYVTTGGGGAFLYPVFSTPLMAASISSHHYLKVDVDGARMSLSATAPGGLVLDRFTIQPLPVLSDTRRGPSFTVTPSGQGSLVRIAGRSLAAEEQFVGTQPGPTEMNGTSVTVNGQLMNLIYASSTQIWAKSLLPIQPPYLLRITNPNGSTVTSVG
jgi:hypothetical protein